MESEHHSPAPRPTVSVVLPAKNESRNIEWVLRRIPDSVDEIVLVDGLSHDQTIEIAQMVKPDLVVVHEERRGKGIALRSGFAAATGEIIVMLDADGSMHPSEIDSFVQHLMQGYDFAKGSRFMAGGGSSDITDVRRMGNRFLLFATNLMYGTSYTDLCYGYVAFRRSALDRMGLSADGFDIEAQLVAQASRSGLRVVEVPSFESPRMYGNSNLNAIRDGFKILGRLLRERFVTPLDPSGAVPEPAELA
ncbi:MAG: glycosyltransferase family 2 protein [Chloroflexota bacterium]